MFYNLLHVSALSNTTARLVSHSTLELYDVTMDTLDHMLMLEIIKATNYIVHYGCL